MKAVWSLNRFLKCRNVYILIQRGWIFNFCISWVKTNPNPLYMLEPTHHYNSNRQTLPPSLPTCDIWGLKSDCTLDSSGDFFHNFYA